MISLAQIGRAASMHYAASEPPALEAPLSPVTDLCTDECVARENCCFCEQVVCDDHPSDDPSELTRCSSGWAHHSCHGQVCADRDCWLDI